jgi:putative solute:sodium symporter small subunit
MSNDSRQGVQGLTERQKVYWQKNIALIRNLLIIWAVISLGLGIILAKPLSAVPFFGVSFSFWIAQQGSILVFVILIFYYAVRMQRLDEDYVQNMKAVHRGDSKGIGGSA